MNREWSKPPVWLIWMMWLALAGSALEYRQNWDQLPARMAVHFDANWNPNGYTSREGAAMLGLGIMAVLLVFFTIGAFIVRAMKQSAAWPMLVLFYVSLAFSWYGNHMIVQFNRNRTTGQSEWNCRATLASDRGGMAGFASTTSFPSLHS